MRFRILGPLEVLDGDKPVRLGAAKQRALLGVLLLHANEPVPSSDLVDELWGDDHPASAEKLVQGYVHALRKILGAEMLVTRPRGYELRLDLSTLDLLEFQRLVAQARASDADDAVELRTRALALWRGPPLADVALEGPERHTLARLSELQLATQIERIEAELRRGRDAQLVPELESLAAANPYQEHVHAQLMLALYRSGRQADALSAYQAVRRRLSDELGLQPGQELRGLEAAILRQDEALTFNGHAAPEPPPPVPQAGRGSPRGAPRGRRARTAFAAAALICLAAVAAAIVVYVRREPAPVTVAPNSLAVIDPRTDDVVDSVPVGNRPGPVAADSEFVWVGNLEDRSLSRIDPRRPTSTRTFSLGVRTPTGLAVGAGSLWVAHGRLGELSRVDREFGRVLKTIDAAERAPYSPNGSVDYGGGAVWAAFGDSTVVRAAPAPFRVSGTTVGGGQPAGIAYAGASVWVSNSDSATVDGFAPATFDAPLQTITVGRQPNGIAAGAGAVWVAVTGDDVVARIDPGATSPILIPVGDGPTSIATGEGAVWVANTAAGTVSRIDPARNDVVDTIHLGNAPAGIAVAGGSVWVAVQAR